MLSRRIRSALVRCRSEDVWLFWPEHRISKISTSWPRCYWYNFSIGEFKGLIKTCLAEEVARLRWKKYHSLLYRFFRSCVTLWKSVSHHQTNKKYRQLHPHGNFKGPNCFNMLWLEVFGMRSKCRGTCRLTILKVCKRITFGRAPSWKFGGVVIYCFSYAEIVESCL